VSSRDRGRSLDPALMISGRRDLVALVDGLARERSWTTLAAVFVSIGVDGGYAPALAELDLAARLVAGAIAVQDRSRRGQAAEVRALRLAIAEALLARSAHPPLAAVERRALESAAELFDRGGDHRRAALVYEELGADTRAAEAWGALGDLERMEAAHAREESRATARRGAGDLLHRFEALLAGGERRAALAAVAPVAGVEEAATLRQRAASVGSRLCRGRAVSLRAPGAAWLRLAALPSEIGRDLAAGVPLRDPSVSRRHALLRARDDGVYLEDAGSRGGISLGGARLEPGVALLLCGVGELTLGSATVLRFRATESSVIFEGTGGLDRGLRALVGAAPLPLFALFPAADGLWIEISDDAVRLGRRADLAVRVDGQLIGPGCDLLHGDLIEVPSAGLRIEVK
jgi:FHA domain-containing protein